MQKFKVKATGKTIKAEPIGNMVYRDEKTGEKYDISSLELIKRKHQWSFGFNVKGFGMYFYIRDYFRFKTFQIGPSVDIYDAPNGTSLGLEIKLGIGGFGIRFAWAR